MIYYKLDSKIEHLDSENACLMPDNMSYITMLMDNHVFIPDQDLIKSVRDYLGDRFKDKVFVDIGTNYGSYILGLYDLFKHSYGFEPNKHVYNILCGNTALHNISYKTTLFNCGLSDKNEILSYNYVDEMGGGNMFTKPNENGDISNRLIHRLDGYNEEYRHTENMQVNRLDDYNITDIGLMKIDVEGFELNVLKGGEQTIINSNYPMILIESWNVDPNDTDEIAIAKVKLKNDLHNYLTDYLGYNYCQQLTTDNYFYEKF